jgi:hypothetical protein
MTSGKTQCLVSYQILPRAALYLHQGQEQKWNNTLGPKHIRLSLSYAPPCSSIWHHSRSHLKVNDVNYPSVKSTCMVHRTSRTNFMSKNSKANSMFTWCLARAPWNTQYGKNLDLSILQFLPVLLQLFDRHFQGISQSPCHLLLRRVVIWPSLQVTLVSLYSNKLKCLNHSLPSRINSRKNHEYFW